MPNESSVGITTWTLVMDINFDQGFQDSYSSLFQDSTGNDGDGDMFIGNDGTIWFDADTAGSVQANQWYRMAFVESPTGVDVYVDGTLVDAMGSGRARAVQDVLLLFVDNWTKTSEVLINSVAFFDDALSGPQVGAWGGPTADGIAVPEPGTLALIAMPGLGLSAARLRKRWG